MGAIQNSINGAIATVGVASRMVGNNSNKGGSDAEIKSKVSAISANKGLLDEYTRELQNYRRAKPMLEKLGKYKQDREDFLQKKVDLFSQADEFLTENFKDTLSKGGDNNG